MNKHHLYMCLSKLVQVVHSGTSVPMEISAACRTSSSTSSGSIFDRSASLISPRIPTHTTYNIQHTHTRIKVESFELDVTCTDIQMTLLTYSLDSSGIGKVVRYNLAHLREMPTIPFTTSHVVVIEFLIQIIQQC